MFCYASLTLAPRLPNPVIHAGMDPASRPGQENRDARGDLPALDLPDWNEALKLRAPGDGSGHGFARTPAKASFKLGPPQVAAPSGVLI